MLVEIGVVAWGAIALLVARRGKRGRCRCAGFAARVAAVLRGTGGARVAVAGRCGSRTAACARDGRRRAARAGAVTVARLGARGATVSAAEIVPITDRIAVTRNRVIVVLHVAGYEPEQTRDEPTNGLIHADLLRQVRALS